MDKTNFFNNFLAEDTLSYKYINREVASKTKWEKSNIIGCTLDSCSLKKVSFYSANYDGTFLINCKFEDGDWSRADCCSMTASGTIFNKIDFTLSTMRDCDFTQCTFIECKFDHIALSGSKFVQCTFKDIVLAHSSTYLNTYTDCTFEKCNIDGNFYYNILLNNHYTKSVFGDKLFAYNYFLLNDNIHLEMIGLDNRRKIDLEDYLRKNNLLINLVVLKLNETGDIDISIIRFVLAIKEILKLNLLIREEQLQFIYIFLQFLISNNKISAITIAEALSYLEESIAYFEMKKTSAYEKCKNTLNLIKNKLYDAYLTYGQNISYVNADQSAYDVTVKIVYEYEPSIPICSILNEIKLSLGINAPDAVRIKTEQGSFYEWIVCYAPVLSCLQLFIDVLGLGFTIMSSRKSKMIEQNNQLSDANETQNNQMLILLQKAISKQKINPEFEQTIHIVVKNDIIATKNFRGYNRSNIQSIDITTKNS